jgi:hypothetical protein
MRFGGVLACLLLAATSPADSPTIWRHGSPGIDQSIASIPEHSELVAIDGLNVSDIALAGVIRYLPSAPAIIWVFAQCFGGGFFDELAGIPNAQIGISAADYRETSHYPLPAGVGNGLDFVWALIRALKTPMGDNRAVTAVQVASQNDPFGWSFHPIPPRRHEVRGSERPVLFRSGMEADRITVTGDRAAAILWAGLPEVVDQKQIASVIHTLLDLGYDSGRIFVLYGRGRLRAKATAGKPVNAVVDAMQAGGIPFSHLAAASRDNFQLVFDLEFTGHPDDPQKLFFLAGGHGATTRLGITSKAGSGGDPDNEDESQDPGAFVGLSKLGNSPRIVRR